MRTTLIRTAIAAAAPGADWYRCQGLGDLYGLGGTPYSNIWYAWTMADNGQWGWVSEVYFQGGGNNEADGRLARC